MTVRRFVSVPGDYLLSKSENLALVTEMTETEFLTAIASLSRRMSAGPDERNKDFYKYAAALLIPGLMTISKDIMDGADLPSSFLKALIIPLRTK